jgi:hypothetical protein
MCAVEMGLANLCGNIGRNSRRWARHFKPYSALFGFVCAFIASLPGDISNLRGPRFRGFRFAFRVSFADGAPL